MSPAKNGKIHDKPQLEKENSLDFIPKDVNIWVDKGYKGIEKILKNPEMNTKIPKFWDGQTANRIIDSINRFLFSY